MKEKEIFQEILKKNPIEKIAHFFTIFLLNSGAYGSSLQSDSAVIVLFDLDKDDCYQLKSDLLQLLDYCDPAPVTLFRIAIEELEALFLGDRKALFEAFPNANESKYKTYKQDSICGTWEFFAEIVFPEGEQSLRNKGWGCCVE